jgi:hypothetical protein
MRQAYTNFGKATEIGPRGGFDGYRFRGAAFERKSDQRHAIADFGRSIEIDPSCALLARCAGRRFCGRVTMNMPLLTLAPDGLVRRIATMNEETTARRPRTKNTIRNSAKLEMCRW